MQPTAVSLTDYQDMVIMFHNETDRGAAVLAGSYFENHLGTYLESMVVDKTLIKQIFGTNGFLSTFSQRIDFAQAFGVLSKRDCERMNLVRKIRNHFAHHPKSASFTEQPVSDWVRQMAEKALDNEGKPLFNAGESGKNVYLLTIAMLTLSTQAPHNPPE